MPTRQAWELVYILQLRENKCLHHNFPIADDKCVCTGLDIGLSLPDDIGDLTVHILSYQLNRFQQVGRIILNGGFKKMTGSRPGRE